MKGGVNGTGGRGVSMTDDDRLSGVGGIFEEIQHNNFLHTDERREREREMIT